MVLAVGLLVAGGQGSAGHSIGHYPSYYPDEIRIDVMDPAAAGKGLAGESLHAYVGAAPIFADPLPSHVKSVKSLGALFVLTLNPASPRFGSARDRCDAAGGIVASLSQAKDDGFVFHPYPVTPHHADYLHHLDRVEGAKVAFASSSSSATAVKIGARGHLAEAVARKRWGSVGSSGDAILEAVAVDELLTAAGMQVDGWSGPPWIKEGWFHAYRLLAPGLDSAQREAVDRDYERLIRGQTRSLAEHADLERRLVAALTSGCRRMLVGYALKEEFFDSRYPEGIENIGYDSLSGLNSPVFIRTVKLKDYPWNGKLHLGVRDPSEAAWNPVAGFTDPLGRLIWSAVGDPAMIPFPFNASWMPNRVQSEVTRIEGQSGGIRVPADALRPQPGRGGLERVGDWTFASAKVLYEVIASPFEDGTEMSVADVLYPFAFAYRWGAQASSAENTHEPRLQAAFAAMHERLVGFKVVRVERTVHAIAEGMNIVVKTPVVEVYLRDAPGDEREVAALAPPWSTVPWHLLVLMEEAVSRGWAAFSKEEAARRQVPWLDIVRDEALRAKLQELIGQFERESFRPEPLKDFVTAEEAQERWRSLRTFAEKNSHLLVANGPYRLKAWSPQSVVLEAVREVTYPLGFGTFDRFVNPPKAVIEALTQQGDEITVRADAEMVLKMGREYQLVKEPLSRTTMRGTSGLLVVSRYVLIGPEGNVLKVDKMRWREDGQFSIKLPERLPPGEYTALLGVFLDGNSLEPSARSLRFHVGARGSGSQ